MTTWNKIVTAVYRNEWLLVENAISTQPFVRIDDANSMAEVLGHIIGERLYRNQPACMVETVNWLVRQPYLNQQKFAEWVALDALKSDSALHKRVVKIVTPFCDITSKLITKKPPPEPKDNLCTIQ